MKGTHGEGYVPRTHPFLSGLSRSLPVTNRATQAIPRQEGESQGGCRRSRAGQLPRDRTAGTLAQNGPS